MTVAPFPILSTGALLAVVLLGAPCFAKQGPATASEWEAAADAAAARDDLPGEDASVRSAARAARREPGGLRHAARLYRRLLSIREHGGDEAAVCEAMILLGSALNEIGRTDESLDLLRTALRRAERAELPKRELAARRALATALQRRGDYREARSLHETILLAARELGRRDLVGRTRLAIAEIDAQLGDGAAALAAVDDVVRDAERHRARALLVQALAVRGLVRLQLDEPESAAESMARCEGFLQGVEGLPAGFLRTLRSNAALAHLQAGDGARAERVQRAALEGFEEADDPWLFAQMHHHLARILLERGSVEEAEPSIRILREQASSQGSAELGIRWALVEARRRLLLGDPEGALAAVERGRVDLDRALADLRYEAGVLGRERRAELFALGTRAAVATGNPELVFDAIETARSGLLLERLGGEFREPRLDGGGRIDLRRLQLECLRDGECLLLTAMDEERSAGLLIDRRRRRLIELPGRPRLATLVESVLAAGGSGSPTSAERFETARATLRAELVASLELDEGTTRIHVVPDGPLAFLPFSLLDPRFVGHTPSATVFARQRLRPPTATRPRRILALGGVDYTDRPGLPPLPGSLEEALSIGDVRLTGPEATESALRTSLASRESWLAVHLACHGTFDGRRPTRSALELGRGEDDDGRLQVLEVPELETNAELVVLSACESARGRAMRGEGLVGFAHGFLAAGARRLLVSQWRVDDAATRVLMTEFYEHWRPRDDDVEVRSAAEALRRAQSEVASRAGWAHPRFWAAWQLWGLDR